MATKDYVKRGHAQKATVTQKKPQTPPQPKKRWGTKIIVMIACLIAAAAAAYGIHNHQQKTTTVADSAQTNTHKSTDVVAPTTPKTPATQPESTTKNTTDQTKEKPVKTAPKEKALPTPPQEQWNYIEQLETKVIPVKEKKQYDLPSQPFLMQCGAYKSKAQAERRQAQIALVGFQSQIRVSQQKSTWYRVILGPYPRRRVAGQARAKMHLHGIEGCAVWQWDL